ncbi:MAG: diguanylate cyclase, partial [Pseudolabrys sp.]
MPARGRSTEQSQYTNWDRARLSVVVPIGVIVAVAIVCIVVDVLSSARHADEIAATHERQLLAHALDTFGGRVLRQVTSVASSQTAIRNIRLGFDPAWADQGLGLWLRRNFDHDNVFLFDAQDKPIYSLVGRRPPDATWLAGAMPAMTSVLDYMRGRVPVLKNAVALQDRLPAPNHAVALRGSEAASSGAGAHSQAAVIRRFRGRAAVIAAAAIGPVDGIPAARDTAAPILMSVKYIDGATLADIAGQLRLTHLRKLGPLPAPPGDRVYALDGPDGRTIARFAWTPQQPGAEIVHSVIPFIAVALAGFALLAGFVLRYMRRTAAAIASGESRLRHLAMHDPLCGLPNRIYFSERLEAVIEEVRAGRAPAALFYIDLDHFKDVNDTLGHHVGDELIRNVTLRLSHTLRGDDLVARLGGDEFAVISVIGNDTGKMISLAQRLIAAICAPYTISGHNIVIGASIGIAVIDKTCGGGADIMRYADMALYRAKNEGRNRACLYDAAMDADLSQRKLLEADLREAIENDGLHLLYQPIVDKS